MTNDEQEIGKWALQYATAKRKLQQLGVDDATISLIASSQSHRYQLLDEIDRQAAKSEEAAAAARVAINELRGKIDAIDAMLNKADQKAA